MWQSALFRRSIYLDVVYVLVYAYVGPTIIKAVGEQWSVRTIAGMALISTVLSLFQALVAKYVPAKVILYCGCALGVVSSASIFITMNISLVVALFALRIAWIMGGVVSQNWDALQWESLAKHGIQARMRTMMGSICSGAALLGSMLAFFYPPSLGVSLLMSGCLELLGAYLSWRVAQEILVMLDRSYVALDLGEGHGNR